jgi:zinc and cadmium transporter
MQISVFNLLLYTFGVSIVAFAGGLPPLFRKWSDRQLHLFIAFGAGTILGAIFLHLLPDALTLGSGNLVAAMVLTGFLLILLLERVFLKGHNHSESDNLSRHEVVGITALVGLSMHSLSGGFALGLTMLDPSVGMVVFIAIIAHKLSEGFSLSTILCLADYSRAKTLWLMFLYSLMTPIGAIIALPFVGPLQSLDLSIPTGLTAGTFLYVATLDLIPEAFHNDKGKYLSFIILLFGIAVMFLIKMFGV